MPHTPTKNYRKACVVGLSLCILAITMIAFLLLGKAEDAEAMKEARRILPGYSVVFEGHTNGIQRCGSLRAFSRQHDMMNYLQIFAPHVEQYNHPTPKDSDMDLIEHGPGLVYDYLDSPEGSGNIPHEHPINSPAGIYESLGEERRPTP